MPLVSSATYLDVSAEVAFALHADVTNLTRLMPGGLARIVRASSPTRQGDLQVLEVGPRFFSVRWVAEIERFEPPLLLVDNQRRGPFRRFRHTHLLLPDGDERSILVDTVDVRLFPGPIGELLDRLLVVPAVRLMFAYRHRRTRELLRAERAMQPAGPASAIGAGI